MQVEVVALCGSLEPNASIRLATSMLEAGHRSGMSSDKVMGSAQGLKCLQVDSSLADAPALSRQHGSMEHMRHLCGDHHLKARAAAGSPALTGDSRSLADGIGQLLQPPENQGQLGSLTKHASDQQALPTLPDAHGRQAEDVWQSHPHADRIVSSPAAPAAPVSPAYDRPRSASAVRENDAFERHVQRLKDLKAQGAAGPASPAPPRSGPGSRAPSPQPSSNYSDRHKLASLLQPPDRPRSAPRSRPRSAPRMGGARPAAPPGPHPDAGRQAPVRSSVCPPWGSEIPSRAGGHAHNRPQSPDPRQAGTTRSNVASPARSAVHTPSSLQSPYSAAHAWQKQAERTAAHHLLLRHSRSPSILDGQQASESPCWPGSKATTCVTQSCTWTTGVRVRPGVAPSFVLSPGSQRMAASLPSFEVRQAITLAKQRAWEHAASPEVKASWRPQITHFAEGLTRTVFDLEAWLERKERHIASATELAAALVAEREAQAATFHPAINPTSRRMVDEMERHGSPRARPWSSPPRGCLAPQRRSISPSPLPSTSSQPSPLRPARDSSLSSPAWNTTTTARTDPPGGVGCGDVMQPTRQGASPSLQRYQHEQRPEHRIPTPPESSPAWSSASARKARANQCYLTSQAEQQADVELRRLSTPTRVIRSVTKIPTSLLPRTSWTSDRAHPQADTDAEALASLGLAAVELGALPEVEESEMAGVFSTDHEKQSYMRRYMQAKTYLSAAAGAAAGVHESEHTNSSPRAPGGFRMGAFAAGPLHKPSQQDMPPSNLHHQDSASEPEDLMATFTHLPPDFPTEHDLLTTDLLPVPGVSVTRNPSLRHTTTSYTANWAANAAAIEASATAAVAAAARALANTPPPPRRSLLLSASARTPAGAAPLAGRSVTPTLDSAVRAGLAGGAGEALAGAEEESSLERSWLCASASAVAASASHHDVMEAAKRIEALVNDMQADRVRHELSNPEAVRMAGLSTAGQDGSFGGSILIRSASLGEVNSAPSTVNGDILVREVPPLDSPSPAPHHSAPRSLRNTPQGAFLIPVVERGLVSASHSANRRALSAAPPPADHPTAHSHEAMTRYGAATAAVVNALSVRLDGLMAPVGTLVPLATPPQRMVMSSQERSEGSGVSVGSTAAVSKGINKGMSPAARSRANSSTDSHHSTNAATSAARGVAVGSVSSDSHYFTNPLAATARGGTAGSPHRVMHHDTNSTAALRPASLVVPAVLAKAVDQEAEIEPASTAAEAIPPQAINQESDVAALLAHIEGLRASIANGGHPTCVLPAWHLLQKQVGRTLQGMQVTITSTPSVSGRATNSSNGVGPTAGQASLAQASQDAEKEEARVLMACNPLFSSRAARKAVLAGDGSTVGSVSPAYSCNGAGASPRSDVTLPAGKAIDKGLVEVMLGNPLASE